MHTESSVREFCASLASGDPVPGGGGGAALAGALGAALAAMVCNFTIGRKRFQGVEAEMRALLARAETVRMELLDLVDADAAAYEAVVAAHRDVKNESAARPDQEGALQNALAEAVRVPLRAAVLAADVLGLCEPLAERGNARLVSDVGVAALLADAALHAAALNVRTNLPQLRDHRLRGDSEAALARLIGASAEVKPRVMGLVQSKLG